MGKKEPYIISCVDEIAEPQNSDGHTNGRSIDSCDQHLGEVNERGDKFSKRE